jgi:hypothetical protein
VPSAKTDDVAVRFHRGRERPRLNLELHFAQTGRRQDSDRLSGSAGSTKGSLPGLVDLLVVLVRPHLVESEELVDKLEPRDVDGRAVRALYWLGGRLGV